MTSMRVRFSPHFVQRQQQRFDKRAAELVQIIESALPLWGAKHSIQSRWSAYGVIDGCRVRVILAESHPGTVTVITAMWS